MTEHLPECGKSWNGGECCGASGSYEFGGACNCCPERQDCICQALTACEARVLEVPLAKEWNRGWVAGAQAALNAVEGLHNDVIFKHNAIWAIRHLMDTT